MKIKKYKAIVRFGTLQFDGHVHDYFVKNTEKLVEFYVLPRGGKEKNFITYYEKGNLIEKREVTSPQNIFLTYYYLYTQYISILFRYFKKNEHFYVINSLPVFFFLNSCWKFFRKFEIVYWIHDYWPMDAPSTRLIRALINYYHKRTTYVLYISDRINKVMNGKVMNTLSKHTVMLGTDRSGKRSYTKTQDLNLAFIGVLKTSQGLEQLLEAVAVNPKTKLTLIGTGEENLVRSLKNLIRELGISKQVYFPNRFLYKKELEKVVSGCHIGVALYEETNNTVTYYADPAKVKQYAEFGFPVIITDTPEISSYITKFNAGEVVHQDTEELVTAIKKIQQNYASYTKGIQKFCEYFSYQRYFDEKFKFMQQSS